MYASRQRKYRAQGTGHKVFTTATDIAAAPMRILFDNISVTFPEGVEGRSRKTAPSSAFIRGQQKKNV